ncbi:MAG TPA: COX15/CtaA family protein [Steroidobacteraceae bacterium]|jgi:cytochrome c oxidase assembly protein subunit 15|nr:COX15/CtaA family protein [Steroidobacteraceae bacterium]
MSRALLARLLALAACLLCFGVVVLGAYVRQSNAGLGCPDWPGCYGHLTPAGAAADQHTAIAPLNGRPLQIGKAWREMVHRYAAGTLGFLIVCLTAMGVVWRRERIVPTGYVAALLAIVIVQGILGMLTVTWQLKPSIVTLHLLFGLTTLSLLWWLVLTLWRRPAGLWSRPGARPGGEPSAARALALLGLAVLAVQIFLGGWTSSNYAAIACPDLPTCQGHWWPQADFRSAFVLWHSLGNVDYEGGLLTNPARVAIHLTHRIGALAATLALAAAALAAARHGTDTARLAARLVLAALVLQLAIGVSMVLRGFPLWLATAHNAGAALLLLATLALNRSLWPPRAALAPMARPHAPTRDAVNA